MSISMIAARLVVWFSLPSCVTAQTAPFSVGVIPDTGIMQDITNNNLGGNTTIASGGLAG